MSRTSAAVFTTLALILNIVGIAIVVIILSFISFEELISETYGMFESLFGVEPSDKQNDNENLFLWYMGLFGLIASLLPAILALYYLGIRKLSAAKTSLLIASIISFISTIGVGFLIFILYILPVLMDIKEGKEKNLEAVIDED